MYSEEWDELFAIKRSTNTSQSIYSLAQTNLGIQAMKQPSSFSVKEELLKYNEEERFNGNHHKMSEEDMDKVIRCKDFSVLWLIEDTDPEYVKEGVSNKDFKLSQFKSAMCFSRESEDESFLLTGRTLASYSFAMKVSKVFLK